MHRPVKAAAIREISRYWGLRFILSEMLANLANKKRKKEVADEKAAIRDYK